MLMINPINSILHDITEESLFTDWGGGGGGGGGGGRLWKCELEIHFLSSFPYL